MLHYRGVKSLFLLTSDGAGKKKPKTDAVDVQVSAPASVCEALLDTRVTPEGASLPSLLQHV